MHWYRIDARYLTRYQEEKTGIGTSLILITGGSGVCSSPVFSGRNMVQRQAKPARHRKLLKLFRLPALGNKTQHNSATSNTTEQQDTQLSNTTQQFLLS